MVVKKRTKKPSPPGTTTYILDTKKHEQRRVTVPQSWRLTFGPTVPYNKNGHGENQWGLRFYDGQALKAIFTDVIAFRDMGIECVEKRVKVTRQQVSKADRNGGKDVFAEARIEEWVDPDAPDTPIDPDYLRLDYKS